MRWIARILSVFLFLVFAIMFVAEGLPRPSELTTVETFAFFAAGAMLAGLVIALWREAYGCVLILGGYAWFTLLDGDLNLTNPFVLFPVTGLLYAGAWSVSAAARRASNSAT